ncbi:MAG TPA: heme exporter protein CcmD [Rhizomicrobium sp.]|jgi:heme exporter protein CcmD|nr:heme exporter protein CcmD [Rhizomicrobium sp.]
MMRFLAMGGYAGFVWPAYGISLAGVAVAVVLTLRSYARAKAMSAEIESGKGT